MCQSQGCTCSAFPGPVLPTLGAVWVLRLSVRLDGGLSEGPRADGSLGKLAGRNHSEGRSQEGWTAGQQVLGQQPQPELPGPRRAGLPPGTLAFISCAQHHRLRPPGGPVCGQRAAVAEQDAGEWQAQAGSQREKAQQNQVRAGAAKASWAVARQERILCGRGHGHRSHTVVPCTAHSHLSLKPVERLLRLPGKAQMRKVSEVNSRRAKRARSRHPPGALLPQPPCLPLVGLLAACLLADLDPH